MKRLIFFAIILISTYANGQALKGVKIGLFPPPELKEGIVCINCDNDGNDDLAASIYAQLEASDMSPITVGGIYGKIYFKVDKYGLVNWIQFKPEKGTRLTVDFIDKVNYFYSLNIDKNDINKIISNGHNYCTTKKECKYCINLMTNTFEITKVKVNAYTDF